MSSTKLSAVGKNDSLQLYTSHPLNTLGDQKVPQPNDDLSAARAASLAKPPKLLKKGGKTRRRKGKKSRKTQKRR